MAVATVTFDDVKAAAVRIAGGVASSAAMARMRPASGVTFHTPASRTAWTRTALSLPLMSDSSADAVSFSR